MSPTRTECTPTSTYSTHPGEGRRASLGVTPVRAAEVGVKQIGRGGDRSQGAGLNDDGVIITAIVIYDGVIITAIVIYDGVIINTIVIYDGVIITTIIAAADENLHLLIVRNNEDAESVIWCSLVLSESVLVLAVRGLVFGMCCCSFCFCCC